MLNGVVPSDTHDHRPEEIGRLRQALCRIAGLRSHHGYFDGADAATEGIRIAKEALGWEPPQ